MISHKRRFQLELLQICLLVYCLVYFVHLLFGVLFKNSHLFLVYFCLVLWIGLVVLVNILYLLQLRLYPFLALSEVGFVVIFINKRIINLGIKVPWTFGSLFVVDWTRTFKWVLHAVHVHVVSEEWLRLLLNHHLIELLSISESLLLTHQPLVLLLLFSHCMLFFLSKSNFQLFGEWMPKMSQRGTHVVLFLLWKELIDL